MLIWIGKYPTHISPYNFSKVVLFPLKPFVDEDRWNDMVLNLAEKIPEKPFAWATKVFLNGGERRSIIRIHKHDLWNIDSTIAPIILELLKKHKETAYGYFMVDDEDLPPNFSQPAASLVGETVDVEYSTEVYKMRRDYVLDEMIYAFQEIVSPDREGKFDGSTTFDMDAFVQNEKRIRNGTTLFGKYLMCLWN